jgi:4-hydroxy-2-oxoheptanedioate aldolase
VTRILQLPSLNARLAAGVAYGVFCELPCAEAAELAGLAGWDFAVLDGEHAPFTAADWPRLVRAASAAGLPAIVRVASNDAAQIQHALDSGAAGVQIPQIASPDAARRAIEAARFHPLGKRGFNPFVRAGHFSAETPAEFVARANRETLVVLQVESADGVAAAEEIAALPGCDVLFLGPYDLSQSVGVPGQTSHPRVLEAASRLTAIAAAHGKAAGVFTNSLGEAALWRRAGMRYVCFSVDTVLLLNAHRQALTALRDADQNPGDRGERE